MTARLFKILLPLLILLGAAVSFADPAGAIPGVGDCKNEPTPQMPARGFSGWIDAGPPSIDPHATSVYETVQYPPQWHTYDLGCGGEARDPAAVLDTTIGNWIKGAATSIVALTNSLHRFVSPPTFLNRLDPLVSKGSGSVRDALYKPWIALSLILLAVIIIWSARKQSLPAAVTMLAWAILVMGLATAIFSYPIQASHAADDLATGTVGQINASMLNEQPNERDPSASRASLLTDNVLYKQWLQGELGSADSVTAQKYGHDLLMAQTFTWQEAKIVQANAFAAGAMTDKKKHDFARIAGKIKDTDPDAYDHLKGQAGSRIGPAFESLMAALFTAPFMIMADLLILVALLIIRMCVILLPAVAVIAVHHSMRKTLLTIFSVVAAALINSIAFAIAAAVNTLSVGLLLGGSTGLPGWLTFLLCFIVMLCLWGAMKPARRLTTMISPTAMKSGAADSVTMSDTRRTIKKLLGYSIGSYAGAGAAIATSELTDDKPAPAAAAPVQAEESWARPEGQKIRDVRNERAVPQPAQSASDPATPGSAPPAVEQTSEPARTQLPASGARRGESEPKPEQPMEAEPIRTDSDQTVYKIWDADSKSIVNVERDDLGDA